MNESISKEDMKTIHDFIAIMDDPRNADLIRGMLAGIVFAGAMSGKGDVRVDFALCRGCYLYCSTQGGCQSKDGCWRKRAKPYEDSQERQSLRVNHSDYQWFSRTRKRQKE